METVCTNTCTHFATVPDAEKAIKELGAYRKAKGISGSDMKIRPCKCGQFTLYV